MGIFGSILDIIENSGKGIVHGVEQVPSAALYTAEHPVGAIENVGGSLAALVNKPLDYSKSGLGDVGYGAAWLEHELGNPLHDKTSWEQYQEAHKKGGGRGVWETVVGNDPLPVRAAMDVLADPLTWAGGIGLAGSKLAELDTAANSAPIARVLGRGIQGGARVLNAPVDVVEGAAHLGGAGVRLADRKLGGAPSGALNYLATRPAPQAAKAFLSDRVADPTAHFFERLTDLAPVQNAKNTTDYVLGATKRAKAPIRDQFAQQREGAMQQVVDQGLVPENLNAPGVFDTFAHKGEEWKAISRDEVPDSLNGKKNRAKEKAKLDAMPEATKQEKQVAKDRASLRTNLAGLRRNKDNPGFQLAISKGKLVRASLEDIPAAHSVAVATRTFDINTNPAGEIHKFVQDFSRVKGLKGQSIVFRVEKAADTNTTRIMADGGRAPGRVFKVTANVLTDDPNEAEAIAHVVGAPTYRNAMGGETVVNGVGEAHPVEDVHQLGHLLQAVGVAKKSGYNLDQVLSEHGFGSIRSAFTPTVRRNGDKYLVELHQSTDATVKDSLGGMIHSRLSGHSKDLTKAPLYTHSLTFGDRDTAEVAARYLHQFNTPEEVQSVIDMVKNLQGESGQRKITPGRLRSGFKSLGARKPIADIAPDIPATPDPYTPGAPGEIGAKPTPSNPGRTMPDGSYAATGNSATGDPYDLTLNEFKDFISWMSPEDQQKAIDQFAQRKAQFAKKPPVQGAEDYTTPADNIPDTPISDEDTGGFHWDQQDNSFVDHPADLSEGVDPTDPAQLAAQQEIAWRTSERVWNRLQQDLKNQTFARVRELQKKELNPVYRKSAEKLPIAANGPDEIYYRHLPLNVNMDSLASLSTKDQAVVQKFKIKVGKEEKTIANALNDDFQYYPQEHEAMNTLSQAVDKGLKPADRLEAIDELDPSAFTAVGLDKQTALDTVKKYNDMGIDIIHQNEDEALHTLISKSANDMYGVVHKKVSKYNLFQRAWSEQTLATPRYITGSLFSNTIDAILGGGFNWNTLKAGNNPKTIWRTAWADFSGHKDVNLLEDTPLWKMGDDYGREAGSVVTESTNRSIVGSDERTSATRQLLSRVVGKSLGRAVARGVESFQAMGYGVDVTMRSAFFKSFVDAHMQQMEPEIRAQIEGTLKRGLPKDFDMSTIDALPNMNPKKLYAYYRALGVDDGFAKAASRRVANEVNIAYREGEKKVGNVFLSYQKTNADQFVAKIIPFHFYSSRKIVWYAQQAMENPVLAANYVRAQEGLHRAYNDPGTGAREKGFIGLMMGPGGFTLMANPDALLGVIRATGLDLSNDGQQDGATGPGRILNVLKNNGVSMYPWIDGALNMLGVYGNGFEPDFLGIRDRAIVGSAVNAIMAATGHGHPDAFYASMNDGMRSKVSNWVDIMVPDWLGKPVQRNVEGSISQASIQHAIENKIIDDNPGLTNGQLVQIMGDSESPEYKKAFEQVSRAGIMAQFLNFVSPFSVKARDAQTDQRAAIASQTKKEAAKLGVNPEDMTAAEASPEFRAQYKQQTGIDFQTGEFKDVSSKKDLVSATPAGKSMLILNQTYNQLGNPDQQKIYNDYQAIMNGAGIPGFEVPPTAGTAQRHQLAYQYLNSVPNGRNDVATLRQLQQDYRAQNPDFDAYKTWQAQMYSVADRFGGSLAAYRQMAAQRSPAIALYLQQQTDKYRKQGLTGAALAQRLDQSVLTPDYYLLSQQNVAMTDYQGVPGNPGSGDNLAQIAPLNPQNMSSYTPGPMTQPVPTQTSWQSYLQQKLQTGQ